MYLSIIIPLYNEQSRFSKTASFITDFLKTQTFFEKAELIFVNDGSTDGTLGLVSEFAKKVPARIIHYEKNMGKGYAVRKGMIAASGDYALFLDADMSTEPNQLSRFENHIKNGFKILIGNRKSSNGDILVVQPLHRLFMGRAFNLLAQIFTGMKLADFNCGFKVFSKDSKEKIFSKCLINRWLFDVEVLFISKLLEIEIIEIPVIWKNDERSTVRLIKDATQSLFDLIRIRVYYALGRYN